MTDVRAVMLAGLAGATFAVLTLWVVAITTAAISFRGRWHSRFINPPSPDWLRVFPRYAYRKLDWRLLAQLTVGAAIVGGLLAALVSLAVIGLGVIL